MTLLHKLGTFALATALCVAAPAMASKAAGDMPKAGDIAPEIVGKTADDVAVSIAQYRGKVVVVSFWATWCTYCIKELPVLENIQKAAGGQVQVLAVNTEAWDVFRQVRKGLKAFTMGMLYDPGSVGQKAYRVTGYPHMVIIGRDGRIHQVYRGYSEDSLDQIAADINSALQGPAAPADGVVQAAN
ncbi:MAG TPA: TlpA disulfide reductase family protein [Telluria sp.]